MPKSLAAIVRVAAILLALLTCASLSIAARHGGTALEDGGHAPAPARVIAPAAPRPAPSIDDAPGTPAVDKGSARTPARHEIAPVAPVDPRAVASGRRDRGRTTANGSRLQRPSHHRGKNAAHGAPATPGMGLLLRMSTSAGREISFVDDIVIAPPGRSRSGRAPPRASPPSTLAPASPPRVFTLATSSRAPRSAFGPNASSNESIDDAPCARALAAREPLTPARPAHARDAGVVLTHVPEPRAGSRTSVRESAAVRSPMPLGGRSA